MRLKLTIEHASATVCVAYVSLGNLEQEDKREIDMAFATALLMNSLRQFVDINKQVLSTTWPKMGEKNPTSVLCLKSTERSMLVKDTVSWMQVY